MSDLVRIKLARVPFNWRIPGTASVRVIRAEGVYLVGDGRGMIPAAMAEAAIEAGYAQSFNPRPATAKRQPAKGRSRAAKPREPDRVDRANLAVPDRANGGAALPDAG